MAILAVFGFVVLCLAPGILLAQSTPAAPPATYQRQVEISVRDALDRPLSGARAEVTVEVGRLVSTGDLVSNDQGLIRLTLEPVIEEQMADKGLPDRFLVYDTAFTYLVHKEGRLDSQGRIEDQQEFAAFADPLYQGLDRRPTKQPLWVPVTLPAYRDYLAKPQEKLSERIRRVIETLVKNDRHFTLTPRSIFLTKEGTLVLGLDYDLLFDPSEMGLRAAAGLLAREPVRDCLRTLAEAYQGESRIKVFEFKVGAGFQYAAEPWNIPEYRTFVFSIPADRAALVLDWTAGQPFPRQAVSVTVQGRPLDLAANSTAADSDQGIQP